MSAPSELEEIRRIAYEIWQAEGEPSGRDREHWERARRIYESRAAESEHAPQPMNPGFEDAEPGKVPDMKDDPAPELPDPPMGRFAKQIHDLPEEKG